MRALLVTVFFVLLLGCRFGYAETLNSQPALVSFGLGYFDFDKTKPHTQAADFRGEYRSGISLLPLISDVFNDWDQVLQFHPTVGLEVNSLELLYGSAGFNIDIYLSQHYVATWTETAGLLNRGFAMRMGSPFEFRSMAEAGYRFDNEMRLTAEISHISNAHLTRHNPGAEIAGLYWHVPLNILVNSP